jgi:hypothetical protein
MGNSFHAVQSYEFSVTTKHRHTGFGGSGKNLRGDRDGH